MQIFQKIIMSNSAACGIVCPVGGCFFIYVGDVRLKLIIS